MPLHRRRLDPAGQRQPRSPITQGNGKRATLGFALLTGDNADNQQGNETLWVAQLLDGGTLDLNSGDPTPDARAGYSPETPVNLIAEAPHYTGVQDYDDYADSDSFYDPDVPDGQFAALPQLPRPDGPRAAAVRRRRPRRAVLRRDRQPRRARAGQPGRQRRARTASRGLHQAAGSLGDRDRLRRAA